MANRLKEDEKNERTIRGLLKLPENRRCINCNSLGPQYVCTSFWTFVCTNCSGIHREFTHRVKSVSMAKFTSQEVSALQGGGNQRAKEVYFKEWDPQRNTAPDGSNVERLRDFIKHVYVDRRFSGERVSDKPPRSQSEDSYRGGSRSPPYEDTYDRRYSDRSSSGGRSPAYEQEYKKSPSQPEVANDWRREDRFGNGRKVDDRRISDGESSVGGSPEQRRESDTSNPPVVRPVREILGENVIPLKIVEPPRANGARTTDSSLQTQRTASSSSLGSTSGNAAEVKWQSSASLIDFDAEPEPPAVAVSQAPPPNQAFAQPAASPSDNNWASFDDVVSEVKASRPPQIVNPLDSVLSQLSTPTSSPAQLSGGPPSGTAPFLNFNTGSSTAMPGSKLMAVPQPGLSGISQGLMPVLPQSDGISSGMQTQQPSLFPASAALSMHQSAVPVGASYGSQPWNAPNSQGLLGTATQPSTAEVQAPGRQELPADLFAATYSPYAAAVPMYGSPYGIGYNMQYNPAMMPFQPQAMPMYPPQSARSINPFDVNVQSSAQAPTFPSMVSLQNALPNVPPSSGLMPPSASGIPSQAAWGQQMPQQAPYQPAMPQQAPTYMPTMTQGSYMGHQMPSATMLPARPQVPGGYSSGDLGAYTNQQRPAANFSVPQTTYNSAPVGGNPF